MKNTSQVTMAQLLTAFEEYGHAVLETDDAFKAIETLEVLEKLMREFNHDPTNMDSMPWIFVRRDEDEALNQYQVDQVIAEAERRGLLDEIKMIDMGAGCVVVFSHAARFFAESICSKYGLGYANMGCTAAVNRDISLMSPYTATEMRLSMDMARVRKMIKEKEVRHATIH